MVDNVKNALFTDKIRSFVTLVLLVLILFVVAMAWLFPRNAGVSAQTVTALESVVQNMTTAAASLQRAATSQQQVNEALRVQLLERKSSRDKLYDDLLQSYGIDANGNLLANGLQQKADHSGGGPVPQGTSGTGQTGYVPATGTGSQAAAHPGPAPVR